ncbi:MAG: glycosyltransferase [Halobacteriota archaeon]
MVGIPCYDEEVAIGRLLLRAFRYADKVVVLDDGSTDKTAEVARLAGVDVLMRDVNWVKELLCVIFSNTRCNATSTLWLCRQR